MPYFERKPYADFDALARQASQLSANSASTVMEDSLLVRQAADILREQSHSLPDWGGAESRGIEWSGPPAALPSLPAPLDAVLGAAAVPVMLMAPPAKAGQQVRIPISLINDSSDDVPCAPQFTDLVSFAGDRIPSTAVSCIRTASSVPGRGLLNADIGIQIPGIPPGEYYGLMACPDAQPAILTVTVSA